MKRCPGCQLEFKPRRLNHLYCTRSCYNKQYNRKRDAVKVELAKQDFRKRNRERLNEEAKLYYREHRLEAIEKAKANRLKRKHIGMLKSYLESI